jgi:anti-sigma regulatory factor (Ser/Thr protein kinase)
MMRPSESFAIDYPSMVSGVRRRVAELTTALGFDQTQAGRAAIVTTELVTNILKHAGGGELILVPAGDTRTGAIDLVAIDRGAGMQDAEQCMRDGYSTAGSPGTGLGAIVRLSSAFDLFTTPGTGTVVHARVAALDAAGPAAMPQGWDVFGIALPHPREVVVGDAWACRQFDETLTVLASDGLGHGQAAHDASLEAVEAFERAPENEPPASILGDIHGALRSTRGAVAAIARIDPSRRELTYAGVGNISGMIVGPEETKRLVSNNGTLGGALPRIREIVLPFPERALLVLSSDGLTSHVDVAKYPGLASRSLPVIAGILMRDFRRGHDDATVVLARHSTSTR